MCRTGSITSLAAVSKRDAFPIPDTHDALDHLHGSRYFTTTELLSGYWQLGMTDRAKERSAFCTRHGLFQFTRMPFGLACAPASFCRLMSNVFKDHLWKINLSYLDDIIVFGRTLEELLVRLRMELSTRSRLESQAVQIRPISA